MCEHPGVTRPVQRAVIGGLFAAVIGSACAPPVAGPAPKSASRAEAPPPAAGADSGGETVAIRSLCGFLLVTNAGTAHFTVELAGNDVRVQQSGDNPLYVVDDLVVQLVLVDHRQMPAGIGKHGVDLLHAHEAWEAAFASKQLGAKVAPDEIQIINKEAGPWAHGLSWWYDLPPGVALSPGISGAVFMTFELADRVVGLSAQSVGGLQRFDVMARLASFWATARISRTELSPTKISAEIRARSERGEACALPPQIPAAGGVDRRLRFDGLAARDTGRLREIADASGGVERLTIDGQRRYRNHVCRFEIVYPDDGWKDFEVQDLSDKGCTANLMTPPIRDPDTGEEFPNAVLIWATKATADFGPEQGALVAHLKAKAAHFTQAKKPLLEGAVDATYVTEVNGTHFAGEILTLRRGDMLYSIHFNSTRGTIGIGRPYFLRWLSGLKLGQ
jgi:hypothetical protein